MRRRGEIDADDVRAPFREAREIDAGAAADFEHAASAIAVEVDEPQQMVQFLEVVLVEVVEKTTRADRVRRDLEDRECGWFQYSRTRSIVDAATVEALATGRPLYYRGWPWLVDDDDQDAMTRDSGRLTARTFDVLVVGGGIYGLTIAYDCAQRGLSVALVDRGDFGSGASFNHLRTIHGGLRYLQTLDIGRARESVRERRTFARIAPDAVPSSAVQFCLSRALSTRANERDARGLRVLDRFVRLRPGTGRFRRACEVPGRHRCCRAPRPSGVFQTSMRRAIDRRGHVATSRQHRSPIA